MGRRVRVACQARCHGQGGVPLRRPAARRGRKGCTAQPRVRTLLPGRARPRAPRRGARGWGGARARPHAPSTVPRAARGPASAQAAPPPRRASARGAACAPLELGAHWLTQPGALPTHAPPPALARARTHARTHAPAVRERTDIMASTGTLRVRGCAGGRVKGAAWRQAQCPIFPSNLPTCGVRTCLGYPLIPSPPRALAARRRPCGGIDASQHSTEQQTDTTRPDGTAARLATVRILALSSI